MVRSWIYITYLAMIPFTYVFVTPLNRLIIDVNQDIRLGNKNKTNLKTKKDLLVKWSRLRFLGTIGAAASFSGIIFGFGRHSSLI